MTSAALAPGTLVFERLRVVRVLGVGGMGAVYEVEHEYTRHRRALKLLHPRLAADRALVERFLRESSAAGRIGNPHIVETYDAGLAPDGAPYLVMELLEGEPLSALLERQRPLPVPLACALLCQVCEAVEAAHRVGIVHRDLKPDNLFITRGADGAPFVKVVDFGISRFDPERTGALELTSTGVMMGTPRYMAPEQLRSAKEVDARADVYALGVILYECLAGRPPYDGATFADLAHQVLSGNAQPLAAVRPDVPPALAATVMRAMAASIEQRCSSARELWMSVAPFAAATPVRAAPPNGGKSLATPAPVAPAQVATPLPPDAKALTPAVPAGGAAKRLVTLPRVLLAGLVLTLAMFGLLAGPDLIDELVDLLEPSPALDGRPPTHAEFERELQAELELLGVSPDGGALDLDLPPPPGLPPGPVKPLTEEEYLRQLDFDRYFAELDAGPAP
ncbi:MAG: protein kinase [Myxococcaceae bacterium]|nr:protein kinase [Myxococcaceae bacterium]